jgi:hypothetical protein
MIKKGLRHDERGFMVNIGIVVILGYALCALAALAFWFHRMGWADGGWMAGLWSIAPFIFALGVMVVVTRLTMDPKLIIGAGIASAVFYWLFFVLG